MGMQAESRSIAIHDIILEGSLEAVAIISTAQHENIAKQSKVKQSKVK